MNLSILEFYTSSDSVLNATARVSVLVSNPFTGKSSSASVDVIVVSSSAAKLSIAASAFDFEYFNIRNRLVLDGFVETDLYDSIQWVVDDETLDLSLSLTPTSASFSPQTIPQPFTLVLPGNVMRPGSVYQFSLTSLKSAVSITVTTNVPPLPGKFIITPSVGIIFDTEFLFNAKFWLDTDLPLTYEFGFLQDTLSVSDLFVLLRGRSQVSYSRHSFLSSNGKDVPIVCRVNVFDLHDAISTDQFSIYLNESSLSATEKESMYENLLSGSRGNIDKVKEVVGGISTEMNVVDCSEAPDCIGLNRMPCKYIDATCGPCFDDYYGEIGSKNSFCFAKTVPSRCLSGSTPKE
jgi:hypothetical protein